MSAPRVQPFPIVSALPLGRKQPYRLPEREIGCPLWVICRPSDLPVTKPGLPPKADMSIYEYTH